jgi:hypothetical protein
MLLYVIAADENATASGPFSIASIDGSNGSNCGILLSSPNTAFVKTSLVDFYCAAKMQ